MLTAARRREQVKRAAIAVAQASREAEQEAIDRDILIGATAANFMRCQVAVPTEPPTWLYRVMTQ
jgi:hypothetical protein